MIGSFAPWRYLVASLWPAAKLAGSVGADGSAIMSRPHRVRSTSIICGTYAKAIVPLLSDRGRILRIPDRVR